MATDAYAGGANPGGAAPDPATLAGVATDLAGPPPTLIAVGELDLFVHDDLSYASRLMAAFHGFDRMAEADVARRFTRDMVDFLRRALA